MLKQTCLITASVTVLSACSLFSGFGSKPATQQPRDLTVQDPYWKRFYELEKEIAHLRLKLDDRSSSNVDSSIQSNRVSSTSSTNVDAGAFLDQIQRQTNQAIAVIDEAISALDSKPTAPSPSPYKPTSPVIAIAGSLQRDQEGEVVQQLTHTQSRQPKYNYSVVYVYQEPRPWDEMWNKLEQANEQDKWRGSNPSKPSYFIYVGAYLKQSDAEIRQDSLLSLLGEGPELRMNHNATALAAN